MTDNTPSSPSRRSFLQTAGIGVAATVAAAALGVPGAPAEAARRAPALSRKTKTTVKVVGQLDASTKKLTALFEQQHPDIQLQYINVQAPDWDSLFTKLLTMVASGQAPDIVTVATEGVQQFAAKGLAAPLDAYVKRDKAQLAEFFADVHPTLVEAMMYNGSLYLLPTDFNAVNMYYDPILLGEAGFGRPSENWTKDDFLKIARATTKKKSNQTNTFGYAWVVRLWGSWTPWIDVAGGDLLQFGRAPGGAWLWDTFYKGNPQAKGRGGGIAWGQPTANSASNLEALQFVMELTKQGLAPVPSVTGGNTLQGFFASKKLAMTPGGGFWAGGLHNAGFTRNQFDVQFFPRWQNQRTHFGTAGKMILKSSGVKDAAWEFCKFYASKQAMEIELAGNLTTPTRRSMMTAQRYAPTGPAHWPVFYETLDHSGTRAMPAPTYFNPLSNAFDKYTTLAVGGGTSAKDALDGLQSELERLHATAPH